MLVVDEVAVRFGGLKAVQEVSFRLARGEALGLIGPNGSGKTTLLNTICGVYTPDSGSVTLNDVALVGRSPHAIAHSGVMRTFQVPRVFSTLTVLENMLLPTIDHRQAGRGDLRERAQDLLDFVNLGERGHEVASVLSGGQQKLLEFARALMTEPSVVLMDEPFAGVHPSLIHTMCERIGQRRDAGTSFVIVSHEIPPLMEVSDRVMCMSGGRRLTIGEPAQVVADEAVIAAYLGRPYDADGRTADV